MKYAKTTPLGVQSGTFQELWPRTAAAHEASFAESQGYSVVQSLRPFDPAIEQLQACPVYQDGGVFFDVQVAPLTPDAAAIERRRILDSQRSAIKAERDRRSDEGGYSVVVEGATKWFHSDAKSKTQQLGLVMLGANAAAVPPWKTMDGSRVPMSQALAGKIFAAAVQTDGALFAAADAHLTALQASADPASYSFAQGWPATFGETT